MTTRPSAVKALATRSEGELPASRCTTTWAGAVRWRKLHRFTALAWLAGLVHALGEGTDAGQLWFLAMVAVVTVPALALLATRLARSSSGAPTGPPASQPQTSQSRPSAPTLTTGVVPIVASRPQQS